MSEVQHEGALTRVGLIGFGNTGRRLYEHLLADDRFAVDFVHTRTLDRLAALPREQVLPGPEGLRGRSVDLVIEAAHPAYVRQWGPDVVREADFAPLSVAGLAEDDLRERLHRVAREHGRRVLLPRGALVGLDALAANAWAQVSVEFAKNPAHIDWADYRARHGGRDADPTQRAVLFEGSARQIADVFPRNINAMVTLALATVGLDECRCRMVSDPGQQLGRLQIDATAEDGHTIRVVREQPMGQHYLFQSLLDILDRVHPRPGATTFV